MQVASALLLLLVVFVFLHFYQFFVYFVQCILIMVTSQLALPYLLNLGLFSFFLANPVCAAHILLDMWPTTGGLASLSRATPLKKTDSPSSQLLLQLLSWVGAWCLPPSRPTQKAASERLQQTPFLPSVILLLRGSHSYASFQIFHFFYINSYQDVDCDLCLTLICYGYHFISQLIFSF